MARLDEGDEVGSVGEAVGRGLEFGFAARGIAAQGHDVADAGSMDAVDLRDEVGAGGADARQVRDDGREAHAGEQFPGGEGKFAGRAAGAVGARDEIGMDGAHALDGAAEDAEAEGVLGRIEFQGERRLAPRREQFPDGRQGHAEKIAEPPGERHSFFGRRAKRQGAAGAAAAGTGRRGSWARTSLARSGAGSKCRT